MVQLEALYNTGHVLLHGLGLLGHAIADVAQELDQVAGLAACQGAEQVVLQGRDLFGAT